MTWTFWAGTTIVTATVGGLVWLRTHPPRVAVRRDATRRHAVLVQLLQDQRRGYRRSGAALRRRVGMTTVEFYDLMEQLLRWGLVRVVQVRTFGQDVIRFDGYQLTPTGVNEALVPPRT